MAQQTAWHEPKTKTPKNPDPDHVFKVVLIGDSGVGKSNILFRFTDGDFKANNVSTVGVDLRMKTIYVDNKFIKFNLWDTAGQERFRSIMPSYYRGANAIVYVYSIDNPESLTNLLKWMWEVDENLDDQAVRLIVASKADLEKERKVSYEEGLDFATQKGYKFIETSAKSGSGVDKLFNTLGVLCMEAYPEKSEEKSELTETPGNEEESERKCCDMSKVNFNMLNL